MASCTPSQRLPQLPSYSPAMRLCELFASASPSLRAFSASASGASHWGPAARVRAAAAGVWAGTRHGARITAAKSRVLWSFIPTFPIGPDLHFSLLSVDRRSEEHTSE